MKQTAIVTFATSNWKKSPIRILSQAKNINQHINMFSTIFMLNEKNLPKEFFEKLENTWII